jgi:hypothetical protein
VPQHNATLACAPRDAASVLVPLGAVDLDMILCHEETRTVGRDNTVSLERQVLQIAAQPGRRSCAGLAVLVRRHLAGGFTITRGAQCLGRYDANGQAATGVAPVTPASSAGPGPRVGQRRRSAAARHRAQAAV